MVRYEKRNIVEYLKKNLKKSYPEESLKWALVNQGYMRAEVMKALEEAKKEIADEAPVLKEKPQIKYEIVDEHDEPVQMEFSLWKKIKGWFVR